MERRSKPKSIFESRPIEGFVALSGRSPEESISPAVSRIRDRFTEWVYSKAADQHSLAVYVRRAAPFVILN